MNLLAILAKFFNIPNVGDTPENKGQCVGLVESYTDTLGLPHSWGNAKDLLENADPASFAITYNDPNDTKQFPPAGSVMVWDGTWGNGNGHTGVIIFADGKKFASLEQNNPVGSAPQTIMHDYKGVKGWFTPKNLPATPTQAMLDACMADRDNFWKQRDLEIHKNEETKKLLEEAQGKLTAFASLGYATVDDITKKVDDLNKTNTGVQTQIQQVLDRNKKLADLLSEKENEDSTAIDVGIAAQDKVGKLEQELGAVAKELNTKPLASEILTRFDYLKRLADWGEKIIKGNEKKSSDNLKKATKKDSQSVEEIFYALFGVKGGGL